MSLLALLQSDGKGGQFKRTQQLCCDLRRLACSSHTLASLGDPLTSAAGWLAFIRSDDAAWTKEVECLHFEESVLDKTFKETPTPGCEQQFVCTKCTDRFRSPRRVPSAHTSVPNMAKGASLESSCQPMPFAQYAKHFEYSVFVPLHTCETNVVRTAWTQS